MQRVRTTATGATSASLLRSLRLRLSAEFPEPGKGQVALVGVEGLQTSHATVIEQDQHDKRNLDRHAIGRGVPLKTS